MVDCGGKKGGISPRLAKSCLRVLGFRYRQFTIATNLVKPAANSSYGLRPVCASAEKHVLECSLLYLAVLFDL